MKIVKTHGIWPKIIQTNQSKPKINRLFLNKEKFFSDFQLLIQHLVLLFFQIKDGTNEFLEEGTNMVKVRIQWEHNHQLFQSTYNQYDEIAKFHNQQMR